MKKKTALVIVHLSSLDAYADMFGLDKAQELAEKMADSVIRHQGPVFVIDQKWPYNEPYSIPRIWFVRNIQLQTDAKFVHFRDDREEYGFFLRTLGRKLDAEDVGTVVVGGLWHGDENIGCVSETAEFLKDYFTVRINPRIVGCIPIPS
jgi:hypothetical protein